MLGIFHRRDGIIGHYGTNERAYFWCVWIADRRLSTISTRLGQSPEVPDKLKMLWFCQVLDFRPSGPKVPQKAPICSCTVGTVLAINLKIMPMVDCYTHLCTKNGWLLISCSKILEMGFSYTHQWWSQIYYESPSWLLEFDNRIDKELDNTMWRSRTFRHERWQENILEIVSNHSLQT